MNILIISTIFPPENSIASLRPYSWAKYWTKAGHSVTVLTVPKWVTSTTALDLPTEGFEVWEVSVRWLEWFEYAKEYLLKQIRTDHKLVEKTTKSNSGLNFISYLIQNKISNWLYNLRAKHGIYYSSRFPDKTDFWVKPAVRQACQKNWDLIISTSGPYTTHNVAYRLKKSGHAKNWIADFRDLWVDNHVFPGLFPFTVIERQLERKWLKRADVITTVSKPLAEILAEKYRHVAVEVIENGFDEEDLEKIPTENFLQDDDKFRLVYTGAIYPNSRDITPIFKALEVLKTKGFRDLDRLEIIFFTRQQDLVEKFIQQYDVANWVKYGGFISRTDSLRAQRDASALLLISTKGLASSRGIITGKVFEYLWLGREIWVIGNSYSEDLPLFDGNTLRFKILADAASCAQMIEKALSDNYPEPTKPDFESLQRFTRRYLAEKMLDTIDKVM